MWFTKLDKCYELKIITFIENHLTLHINPKLFDIYNI